MSDAATSATLDSNHQQLSTQVPTTAVTVLNTLRSYNSMVILILLGAAAVALIAALFMWASSPNYRVLFSNLSEADGGQIIAELDKRTVPYRFNEGGSAILVPSDQVHLLRLQLAEQGLPNGGGVGFELMDKQPFGISQFAEQLNFQRGLEGELVQSIQALGPVANARIHLAMSKPSVFVREKEPAKASVLVTLHPGRVLDAGQVNAIMHMVSSGVAGLTLDNITVVDQAGNLLSEKSSHNNNFETTQLSHIKEVEGNFQQRIENTLTPLFGQENINVQVTAQIDFSRREETSETYAPNQDSRAAAIRSAQWSNNVNGANGASGIPGALSNTPPLSTPSQSGKGKTDSSESDAAIGSSYNNQNTVNYEVDRNIVHIQHQYARIERLSSAVVINYRNGADEEGNPTQLPLSEEELQQVTLLVKQAIGFSEDRGDQVQVVNSPFTAPPVVAEVPAPPAWKAFFGVQEILALARYTGAALGALIIYLLILKPIIQRQASAVSATKQLNTATTEQSQSAEPVEEPEIIGLDATRKSLAIRKRKASSYEQSIDELRSTASEDPRLIAMIVRSWMNK